MARPRKLSEIQYRDDMIRKMLQPETNPKTQMALRWHINHLICMVREHVYAEEYKLAGWHWSNCLRCQHTKPTK